MKKYLIVGVGFATLVACQPQAPSQQHTIMPTQNPETISMTKTASEAAEEKSALEAAGVIEEEAIQVASADAGMMCLTTSVLANDYVTLIPADTPGKLENGRFTYNGIAHDISNTNYSAKPC